MALLSEYAAPLLSRCQFDPTREEVSCAVSGGADSLALLALAVFSGHKATAYHVDHGIRECSAQEADVVAHAAEQLGASFVALSVSCPPGPNLEARARAARFAVLPLDVATGHTADDQAETVIVNLLRGAGLDGMAAMRPGPRHPILALRRSETVALVESLRLQVVHDPSNDDASFWRNRIRHEMLPLLCDIATRDVVPILARQAALFADEAQLLDDLAKECEPTDARQLAGAPLALARRAVRRWVKNERGAEYPVDAEAIERILKVARGDVLACEITEGRRISRSKGRLYFDRVKESEGRGRDEGQVFVDPGDGAARSTKVDT